MKHQWTPDEQEKRDAWVAAIRQLARDKGTSHFGGMKDFVQFCDKGAAHEVFPSTMKQSRILVYNLAGYDDVEAMFALIFG
jgi:hypothetical protein